MIDFVPLIIDHDFIRKIEMVVQERLIDKLAIGQDGSALRHASYLREDAGTVAEREELELKKTRLGDIIVKLAGFYLSVK